MSDENFIHDFSFKIFTIENYSILLRREKWRVDQLLRGCFEFPKKANSNQHLEKLFKIFLKNFTASKAQLTLVFTNL